MVLLAVSILFMAGLALCLRIAADRGAEALTVNAVYRCFSGLLGLALMTWTLDWHDLPRIWPDVQLHVCVGSALFWAAGLASVRALQTGPLGTTWTVVRLSTLIPTLASIVYWHEIPLFPVNALLVLRGSGIVAATVAVIFLGTDMVRRSRRADHVANPNHHVPTWALWLLAAFVIQGGWEITLRSTRSLPSDDHRAFFMGMVFLINLVLSIPVMALPKYRPRRMDLTIGAAAGLFSFVGSGLRPWILRDVPGTIVFPATAVGVTTLVLAASVLWWKEKIGPWGIAGIVTAITAIVLLSAKMG